MAENQHVGIRKEGLAALFPALACPVSWIMLNRTPSSVTLAVSGKRRLQRVAVVVAVNTDQPPAALFEFVEQIRADPVTGVEHHVSLVDGGPHLFRQRPGALRDVRVGNKDQAQAHRSIFPWGRLGRWENRPAFTR